MTLKRLPDALQIVNRSPCLDAEHNPPVFADVPAGSYIHSCPTCGNSVRIEVAAVADAVRKETEAAAGVGRELFLEEAVSLLYDLISHGYTANLTTREKRWFAEAKRQLEEAPST